MHREQKIVFFSNLIVYIFSSTALCKNQQRNRPIKGTSEKYGYETIEFLFEGQKYPQRHKK